jgi:pyridinium-3,5-bisthiocarboxylic acid mononucleotide nickel chelatase
VKVAYFDTIAGIAGDMTLAALVSAGVRFDDLVEELHKLPLQGFDLSANHLQRNAIDALHIDVIITQQPKYHRHLKDILEIIDQSAITDGARDRARAIFRVLAEAEARVHNSSVERIHFHEVGALDSIIDIVGVAICLDRLGVECVYSSPVRIGSGGLVQTQHGTMPTPVPATVELLKGYPVILTGIPEELTTPTGAAIIKALSTGVLRDETLLVEAIGYGAGTKEFPGIPNLLRVMIGTLPELYDAEESMIIETNIDDMNPQLYPHIVEKLIGAGANDAYLIPVIMKKGRPGIILTAIAPAASVEQLTGLILRETSSIGLRVHPAHRVKLQRREVIMQTPYGEVRAKAVLRDGREIVTPEFEECKRIAAEKGIAVMEVMKALGQLRMEE